jgi:hypothetical protein
MQMLKLQTLALHNTGIGGDNCETRAIDLATGVTEQRDTQPGVHMLKPYSDKTAVSFGKALHILANTQVANFGIAQHWKWG